MSVHVASDESLFLVQDLLLGSLSQVNEEVLISADHFNCTSQYGFDSQGSARIEILNDFSVAVADDEKILLHGLVENVNEQRGSLTFFCQIEWRTGINTKKFLDKNRECLQSLVVDFTKDSKGFFSSAFSLTFKNQKDGQTIGHGTGYLIFENSKISVQ